MSFLLYRVSYRWIILFCCVLAYAVSFLVRWSYTGLAPYISEDLGLDKGALGLLGAAFFYPYALAQIPWGWLTDRIGGRLVIACGVLLSAIGLACFATAVSLWEAMAWRMVLGLVAATAFVPIASLLAQWFSAQERGLANGVYYGLGGGVGQGTAFFLMPFLTVYVLNDSVFPISGWRGALVVVALILGILGVICLLFLRSYPSGLNSSLSLGAVQPILRINQPEKESVSSFQAFYDPTFWLLGALFSASLIALRLVPAWISLYASDIFFVGWNYGRDAAVVAGGVIGVLYTIGHIFGSPLLGKLSDWLLHIGVQRLFLPIVCLGIGALLMTVFLTVIPPPWLLGAVALLLGIVLHAFPIMNAVVAEKWGVTFTGQSLGGINMIGQIVGAFVLSVSGYIGMAFSSGAADPLSEYQGIWYGVMVCGFCGVLCGWMACSRLSLSSK